MLSIIILIGVVFDDIFIFCDTWKMVKIKHADATLEVIITTVPGSRLRLPQFWDLG